MPTQTKINTVKVNNFKKGNNMKNKKTQKALKLYGLIGQSLCACAGGIVGFVLGGPLAAIPGIFIGSIVGHFLEKGALKVCS